MSMFDHEEGCDCGTCRYKKGVCARCGKEPLEDGMNWGRRCNLNYCNDQRRKDVNPLLTMEEYDDIMKTPPDKRT